MSELVVERARETDRDAIVHLLVGQYQEHAFSFDRVQLDTAVVRGLVDPRALFLIARRDNVAIGVAYLAFLPSMEHAAEAAWLEELFVEPLHRDAGIGNALIDAAIAEARARCCAALELEVDATHERAANLYRRRGFSALARVRYSLVFDVNRTDRS